jgi:hypothetical protein
MVPSEAEAYRQVLYQRALHLLFLFKCVPVVFLAYAIEFDLFSKIIEIVDRSQTLSENYRIC